MLAKKSSVYKNFFATCKHVLLFCCSTESQPAVTVLPGFVKYKLKVSFLVSYAFFLQIGITLRSEEVLRKVFFELSGEIITTEIKAVKYISTIST